MSQKLIPWRHNRTRNGPRNALGAPNNFTCFDTCGTARWTPLAARDGAPIASDLARRRQPTRTGGRGNDAGARNCPHGIACTKLPARNCLHEMAPELPPRMAERKGPEIDSPDSFASAWPGLRAPPKTRNRLRHSHNNFVRAISCGISCRIS